MYLIDMTAMPVSGQVFIGQLAGYSPAFNAALAGKKCAVVNASVCAFNVATNAQVGPGCAPQLAQVCRVLTMPQYRQGTLCMVLLHPLPRLMLDAGHMRHHRFRWALQHGHHRGHGHQYQRDPSWCVADTIRGTKQQAQSTFHVQRVEQPSMGRRLTRRF